MKKIIGIRKYAIQNRCSMQDTGHIRMRDKSGDQGKNTKKHRPLQGFSRHSDFFLLRDRSDQHTGNYRSDVGSAGRSQAIKDLRPSRKRGLYDRSIPMPVVTRGFQHPAPEDFRCGNRAYEHHYLPLFQSAVNRKIRCRTLQPTSCIPFLSIRRSEPTIIVPTTTKAANRHRYSLRHSSPIP